MRSTLLAPLLFTAACELPSQEWSPLLPDDRLLVQQDSAAGSARSMGEPSEYAATLAELTSQANQGVGEVLELVGMITTLPASHIDSHAKLAVWGPFLIDGTAIQLTIQEDADAAITWGVQVRPSDEGAAWLDALAGHIDPGATEDGSVGHFAMDFGVAEVLELGDDLAGEVEVAYTLRRAGATTDITFDGLSETVTVPVDGTIHFDYDRDQGGEMLATLADDVDGSPSDVPETVALRARWDERGAGRTDALLSGGDFGDDEHTESECWSTVRTVVYYTNSFQDVADGNESECTFTEASFAR